MRIAVTAAPIVASVIAPLLTLAVAGDVLTWRTRIGDSDTNAATAQHRIVQLIDGLARVFVRRHLHEREASSAACLTVSDDLDITHWSERLERGSNLLLVGLVVEVADVKAAVFVAHWIAPLKR